MVTIMNDQEKKVYIVQVNFLYFTNLILKGRIHLQV
jgi:hypothetical protein